MELQTFTAIAERDIDLLLVEEFNVNVEFGRWFLSQIGEKARLPAKSFECWHSVTDGTLGESDLIVRVDADLAILIENKVDAPAQPDQARRYHARGERGLAEGHWRRFASCIVAPAAYLARNAEVGRYDAAVSYESIRDWFIKKGGRRFYHKAEMLSEGIEQNRRGYSPTPDESVTELWQAYYERAHIAHPELQFSRPGQKPAKSDWPEFKPKGMPKGTKIIHKLAQGVVDLQIDGTAGRVEEMDARCTCNDVEMVATGKSAVYRIRVPKIDRFVPFAEQANAVDAGLAAAKRLLQLVKEGRLEI